ncbi:MAG TPA: glycosyltransferase family 4 protein [Candidatus Dormibacteraeota bacterium]|nr:glycosyltransferase family 4 protein [Candidatus Dormibacteraeota bacterium]
MSTRPLDVLVVGSLPLAAPWNGADKMLARTIVTADELDRYIVQTGPDDEWPAHVDPVREPAPATMPGGIAELRGAAYLLRTTARADLIHVIASRRHRAPIAARLLRAWSRAARRPVVHSVPSLGPDGTERAGLVGDVTVVFSRHTADRLRAAGIDEVVTMFPPVSLADLRASEPVEEVRAHHALGPRAILYAAHLDPDSGIREAVHAMARLPSALADATLALAVRWRPGQDPDRVIDDLRRDARHAGVADRLRFITDVRDMPALIEACAVTALVPRHLDGKMDLPLVLLESLALGRPIVVTDRAPINESLLGGGLAVPFGDVDALASAFTELLVRAELRADLAAVGRRQVRTLADPTRAASLYRDVYERAIELRSTEARTA